MSSKVEKKKSWRRGLKKNKWFRKDGLSVENVEDEKTEDAV